MELLAEKARKVAARRQAAKKLVGDVDAELRANAGCLPCSLFRRKQEATATLEVEATSATTAAAGSEVRVKAGAASALFGLAKKQASPVDKLAEAAEAVAPLNLLCVARCAHRLVLCRVLLVVAIAAAAATVGPSGHLLELCQQLVVVGAQH